jgi:hypothetical protein
MSRLPLWKRNPVAKPPVPDSPSVIKLPPNGPKPWQSVSSWLHGKDLAHRRATDINTNTNR